MTQNDPVSKTLRFEALKTMENIQIIFLVISNTDECKREITHSQNHIFLQQNLILVPQKELSCFLFLLAIFNFRQIIVTARSKVWTVSDRSNTGTVGSNPTQDMDVYVRLFCVCVVLCVGNGLARGWSLVQGVLTVVYSLKNWKIGQVPQGL
jgi:hypothetical protein